MGYEILLFVFLLRSFVFSSGCFVGFDGTEWQRIYPFPLCNKLLIDQGRLPSGRFNLIRIKESRNTESVLTLLGPCYSTRGLPSLPAAIFIALPRIQRSPKTIDQSTAFNFGIKPWIRKRLAMESSSVFIYRLPLSTSLSTPSTPRRLEYISLRALNKGRISLRCG